MIEEIKEEDFENEEDEEFVGSNEATKQMFLEEEKVGSIYETSDSNIVDQRNSLDHSPDISKGSQHKKPSSKIARIMENSIKVSPKSSLNIDLSKDGARSPK